MVSETVYDERGIAIKSFTYHRNNPASRFVQESEMNEKGQVAAELDARGENRTQIKYLDGTNIVTGTIAPDGQEFVVGLDPHTDELLAISSSVQGEPNETRFVHTKGLLTRMMSGGTVYDYSYDGWGRKTGIRIADKEHVKFKFDTDDNNGNETLTVTYANNESYETITDKFGKILKVHRTAESVKKPFVMNQYDKESIFGAHCFF